MTDYAGSIVVPVASGERGVQRTAVLKYVFSGGFANTDTITFSKVIPSKGVYVDRVELVSSEIDTNATPTATLSVGTVADPDGFIAATGAAVNKSNSLAENVYRSSMAEALINTRVTASDIVVTIASAVATAATSGTVTLFVTYRNL